MKKVVLLAAVVAGTAVIVRRRGASSRADAELWAEATAPRRAPKLETD